MRTNNRSQQQPSLLKERILAFKFAFEGLKAGFIKEIPMRLHIISCVLVLIFGYAFQINKHEWIFLILCCGMVVSAELMNTAIEKVCDLISEQYSNKIKYIKDLGAAAVFVLAIAASSIAFVIFKRYVIVYYLIYFG